MARRVLYIVGGYPVRTETFVEREIQALRTMGLAIEVSSLDSTRVLQGLLQVFRRPRTTLSLGATVRSDPFPSSLRRTTSAILRSNCLTGPVLGMDHVHAHFLGLPATVAFCLSRLTGMTYSLTAHAHDIYAEETPEVVLREAVFRTTCTETNRRFLAEKHPDVPFELIRHGLDPAPYEGRPEARKPGPCRILSVTRLVEKKGLEYLVEACRLLSERDLEFECRIVGEGPREADLRNLIDRCGLVHRVQVCGSLPHEAVIQEYHKADVLVAPSVVAGNGDRDGVPNVILEAMAAGRPVIASDAGSIVEVVRDGETGLLVPQRDPAAIAECVSRLWKEPDLKNALVRRARQFVQTEYEPERWASILYDRFKSTEDGG